MSAHAILNLLTLTLVFVMPGEREFFGVITNIITVQQTVQYIVGVLGSHRKYSRGVQRV